MRGLPPLPDEILTFEATIDVNGSDVSIVQHFQCPGSIAWGPTDFQDWITNWFNSPMLNLLNVMPSSSSFTTCRLIRVGTSPLRFITDVSTNAGVHGECQSLNSAVCLTWHTAGENLQSRSHNRFPCATSVVDNAKRKLQQEFWTQCQLQCAQYIANCNAIVGHFSVPTTFVVVSRAQAGKPRAAAAFSPVVNGDAGLNVATLRRRI